MPHDIAYGLFDGDQDGVVTAEVIPGEETAKQGGLCP